MSRVLFYKIDPTRTHWLGERYFRFDNRDEVVVQVCVNTGEVKKGRGHVFGVYVISKITFFGNYLAMQYAIPIKKSEYDKNLKKVIKILTK